MREIGVGRLGSAAHGPAAAGCWSPRSAVFSIDLKPTSLRRNGDLEGPGRAWRWRRGSATEEVRGAIESNKYKHGNIKFKFRRKNSIQKSIKIIAKLVVIRKRNYVFFS